MSLARCIFWDAKHDHAHAIAWFEGLPMPALPEPEYAATDGVRPVFGATVFAFDGGRHGHIGELDHDTQTTHAFQKRRPLPCRRI